MHPLYQPEQPIRWWELGHPALVRLVSQFLCSESRGPLAVAASGGGPPSKTLDAFSTALAGQTRGLTALDGQTECLTGLPGGLTATPPGSSGRGGGLEGVCSVSSGEQFGQQERALQLMQELRSRGSTFASCDTAASSNAAAAAAAAGAPQASLAQLLKVQLPDLEVNLLHAPRKEHQQLAQLAAAQQQDLAVLDGVHRSQQPCLGCHQNTAMLQLDVHSGSAASCGGCVPAGAAVGSAVAMAEWPFATMAQHQSRQWQQLQQRQHMLPGEVCHDAWVRELLARPLCERQLQLELEAEDSRIFQRLHERSPAISNRGWVTFCHHGAAPAATGAAAVAAYMLPGEVGQMLGEGVDGQAPGEEAAASRVGS